MQERGVGGDDISNTAPAPHHHRGRHGLGSGGGSGSNAVPAQDCACDRGNSSCAHAPGLWKEARKATWRLRMRIASFTNRLGKPSANRLQRVGQQVLSEEPGRHGRLNRRLGGPPANRLQCSVGIKHARLRAQHHSGSSKRSSSERQQQAQQQDEERAAATAMGRDDATPHCHVAASSSAGP